MRALLERKLVFFLTEGRKEEGVGYWMARWESFWQSFKRFIRRNESIGGLYERWQSIERCSRFEIDDPVSINLLIN